MRSIWPHTPGSPLLVTAARRMALNETSNPMNRFSMFAILYMAALTLEVTERWRDPGFTVAFLLAAAAIVLSGVNQIKFLAFLIFSGGYFLVFHFPDVANHVNLIIYCNAVLVLVMAGMFVRRRGRVTDDEFFDAVSPVLRASLIVVYFLAGFHKLNRDYFDPEVSCAVGMVAKVTWAMQSDVFGVPVALVLATVFLVIVYRLVGGIRSGALRPRLSILMIAACAVGALLVLLAALLDVPTALLLRVGLAAAILILAWELIGSLLLAVPRLQVVMVPFSLGVHAVLAMVGFVDFGALAFALLFTFVPPTYHRVLNDHAKLPGIAVNRLHAYFWLNIAGGVLAGFDEHVHRFFDRQLVAGLIFNSAVLIVILPMLATLLSTSPRPPWAGVQVLTGQTTKALYAFPVLLLLFGMTPYLGLRTAGTFSMFSNLRTEGDRSNHLLLGSNPMKIWGYQEDAVRILEIDDRFGVVIHHYDQSPQDHRLPVVEFRKWIHQWTHSGFEVPVTFEYRGQIHTIEDITQDPTWSTRGRTPQMYLMDFRVIQPDGPNLCRW